MLMPLKKVVIWFKNLFRKKPIVLSPEQMADIVAQVLAAMPNNYLVSAPSPSKGELLEYSPHPLEVGSYLVKYQKNDGPSQHTIPVPSELSHLEIVEYLKSHPASHL